jgi:hypothetical protein
MRKPRRLTGFAVLPYDKTDYLVFFWPTRMKDVKQPRQRVADNLTRWRWKSCQHLDAAEKLHSLQRSVDKGALARYIVAVIEGSIMLARTDRNRREVARNFENLKEYLKQTLGA